jgi:peptide/nickel transport system substrate-binding protein
LHRLFIEDSPMVVWSSGVNVSAYAKAVRGYAPWPGRKPRFWDMEVMR